MATVSEVFLFFNNYARKYPSLSLPSVLGVLIPKVILTSSCSSRMRLYRGQRMAESLLIKDRVVQQCSAMDRSSWYEPKTSLLSPTLQSTFVLSYFDSDTEKFIADSIATSNSLLLQLYYYFVSFVLSFFITKTSINGLLNRGGMFLFSTSQLQEFLSISTAWNSSSKQLLDLGAGDGGITKALFPFFENVYVTEMSQVMQWRLRCEGYHIEDVEGWSSTSRQYDLISALNLIDRHYNPKKLLKDLHTLALRSNCLVLLAVVLPVHQYVEFHPSRKSTKADVRLAVQGLTLEEHASALVENEFMPAGFEVVRWTKLPYLCEGDLNRPYYVLDDVVFLLRPIPNSIEAISDDHSYEHSEL
ncbi:hypothetical protein Q1695_000012 [Nippostrongylus brasiliensis]|nr:hypothetical protein Q1695_000012 [Nippostrongylus brasiliensis]